MIGKMNMFVNSIYMKYITIRHIFGQKWQNVYIAEHYKKIRILSFSPQLDIAHNNLEPHQWHVRLECGSSSSVRVKPTTLKLVFSTSPLNTQH